MKSYGKVDETWDDAKFQTIIKDAICMAREQKKQFAVGQDTDGTVVVALSQEGYPPIFVCVATAWNDEKFQEDDIVLRNNDLHECSVGEMVPRVRDVLTKGIVNYGGLGFLSEGRNQLRDALGCANSLIQLYKSPFIVGQTDKGIMVAPLSERDKFLVVGSCVVTKNGYWSMSDKMSKGGCHYMDESAPPLATDGVARCSVMIHNPAVHIYCGILESGRLC